MTCLRKKNKSQSSDESGSSYEKEGFEDIHLLDPRLAAALSSKLVKLLQYVHRTQMRELNHLKPVIRYEIKDFLTDGPCDQG